MRKLKAMIASVTESKNKGEFSISQRQPIIKLIEKKIETHDISKIGDPFPYQRSTLKSF